jgi:hypothetical protein
MVRRCFPVGDGFSASLEIGKDCGFESRLGRFVDYKTFFFGFWFYLTIFFSFSLIFFFFGVLESFYHSFFFCSRSLLDGKANRGGFFACLFCWDLLPVNGNILTMSFSITRDYSTICFYAR